MKMRFQFFKKNLKKEMNLKCVGKKTIIDSKELVDNFWDCSQNLTKKAIHEFENYANLYDYVRWEKIKSLQKIKSEIDDKVSGN